MQDLLNRLDTKTLKAVRPHIAPDEDVFVCIVGNEGQSLIGLSDRILISKRREMVTNWATASIGWIVNSFPYRQVTGIQVQTFTVLLAQITVQTPGIGLPMAGLGTLAAGMSSALGTVASLALNRPNSIFVRKSDLPKWEPSLATLREGIRNGGLGNASMRSGINAQPTGGSGDLASELERLSQLRKAGVLTEEEFVKAKAKLLG